MQFYHEMKKKRGMNGKPGKNVPQGKFYPTFALQTHSQNPKDENVQLWAVAFE